MRKVAERDLPIALLKKERGQSECYRAVGWLRKLGGYWMVDGFGRVRAGYIAWYYYMALAFNEIGSR